MFTWKYIDIPADEVKYLQEAFLANLPNNELFFQDISIGVSKILNLDIAHTVLIQVAPLAGTFDDGIHVDNVKANRKLAINIPLQNCETSITKFWKNNQEPEIHYTSNGFSYYYFNPQHCELIDQVVLDRPFIFDASVPHSVTNLCPLWRRAISIRLQRDPIHLI
jgi:hypothetical protein